MVYRAQLGAENPADVFIPIMIATFIATLVGMIAVCLKQGINLLQRSIMGFMFAMATIIAGTILIFQSMPQEKSNNRLKPRSEHHPVLHYLHFYREGVASKNQRLRCLHRRGKRGF